MASVYLEWKTSFSYQIRNESNLTHQREKLQAITREGSGKKKRITEIKSEDEEN